jgi:type IV pilus assembly protein PilM
VIKLSRKVLCLDWDKRSLRIVVARVGKGRAVLEDAHSHRLPNNVDADEPEAMGDFIHAMLRRHHLSYKSVVVDVPRERAVINRLALPPTPPTEVAAAVRFQAMKELPFAIETAAVDYIIMGRDERGMATEVLLAAVTTDTLDRVRLTCEAAGLTPARIGLRPYANLISVRRTRGTGDQHVLLLDVGPAATEIDVICGDALAFARSANVSVPLPVSDPATREDSHIIPLAEVRDLDTSDQAVEAAISEVLVEATRTLQAYRATEAEARIDEIVVAGGTGIEAQLADRLQQRLELPVALFDPTEALGLESSEGPKLRSFAAALGLAWGLGREGSLALDFLNPKRPISSRETLQRRARIGALAAALVLVAVAGILSRQYLGLRSQLGQLRKENRELQTQVQGKVEIANRIDEAREWATEAVWPDELLNVVKVATESGLTPGEKMVVQEIVLDIRSRTPGITLRNLYASDAQVPIDFVKNLIAREAEDGERVYEAVQRTGSTVQNATRFNWKTDVAIQLLKLQEFREGAGNRAKERKERLRDIGRL